MCHHFAIFKQPLFLYLSLAHSCCLSFLFTWSFHLIHASHYVFSVFTSAPSVDILSLPIHMTWPYHFDLAFCIICYIYLPPVHSVIQFEYMALFFFCLFVDSKWCHTGAQKCCLKEPQYLLWSKVGEHAGWTTFQAKESVLLCFTKTADCQGIPAQVHTKKTRHIQAVPFHEGECTGWHGYIWSVNHTSFNPFHAEFSGNFKCFLASVYCQNNL